MNKIPKTDLTYPDLETDDQIQNKKIHNKVI